MAAQFCQTEKNFLTIIKVMCDKIMLKNGPYLKEGIYQEMLYHELVIHGLVPKREVVFGAYFIDSEDKQVFIGNGHSLRSDIEIPMNNCILELKSSGNDTKEENIWQLRNYLEKYFMRIIKELISIISMDHFIVTLIQQKRLYF